VVKYRDNCAGCFASPTATVTECVKAWQYVGNQGFSISAISETSLFFSSSGIPFMSFRDSEFSSRATVMWFNGSIWQPVGGSRGVSDGYLAYLSLCVYNEVPYLAYMDNANSNNATVLWFNGSSWQTVGAAGFSDGVVNDISISIAGDGTIYVAYKDVSLSGRLTVMWFNGTSWLPVGGSKGITMDSIMVTSIFVTNSGTPFVAYINETGYVNVLRFDNVSGWEQVGGDIGNNPYSNYIHNRSLFVSGDGTPYLAYVDNAKNIIVMKFTTVWQQVGDVPGETKNIGDYVPVFVTGDDVPYVAFADNGENGYLTVKRFNGSSWQFVGESGFSANEALFTALFVYDGIPYVGYMENNNGYASVMKYDCMVGGY